MQATEEHIIELINEAIYSIKYPEIAEGLYEPIKYTLESGGKRLRPRLLLASYGAFSSDKPIQDALPQALGIEIFHNFTLLHDDVMDHADLRRGRPTVHRRWNVNQAILSGDAMLTLATQYMSQTSDKMVGKVLHIYNKAAAEVYQGQQLDMDFETRQNVSVEEYIEMIRLKTSVLLGAACEIGAYLAGANEEACEALYNYGINLGLAFQLKDDLLDTFGDPLEFGKEIGGDILNLKKTWLLITALNESPSEIKDIIENVSDPKEKIEKVINVYNSLNLRSRCHELINDYISRAMDAIKGIDMNGIHRDYFIMLAQKSALRTH